MYLIGGYDYVSGPYFITFPANMTSVIFNVTITDDDAYESLEKFALIINSTSLPSHIFCEDPYIATVSIRDDERRK